MARILLAIFLLSLILKAGNITVVYFWQPGCLGCEYMEKHVFSDPQAQSLLSKMKFVKQDVRLVNYIEGYAEYVLVVEGGSLTYINGTFKASDNWQTRLVEINDYARVPIIATPAVVVLEEASGRKYIRGYLLGALPPDKFIQFLDISINKSLEKVSGPAPGFSLIAAILFAVGLGAASAISPCIVLPLALATTRKKLIYFIGGGIPGYAVWSATLALFGLPIYLDKNLSAILITTLGTMYIIGVKRLFWRVQTFFHKVARGSDVLVGVFMPFISLPCFLPLFGIAGVLSMALFTTPMERFLIFLFFGVTYMLLISLIGASLGVFRKFRTYVILVLIAGALVMLYA
ncbi:hypothetical protein Pogu_1828 [Pyrobaculum oguniense TE7]|uniref:Cytochrome c biogenesis protein n=1 Tax=Pyrobaculum oguniense (strain DSM 13380 / JCM 10595 / TE7) TaxID=698757 RepID=H6Q9I7_PYROT|nr:hypothetical protein Pogu_1828 [Pyrobaculum oguniense TE7]